MIERIHIKNFKSIYDLEIDVGRVNLIIGENGSGKSNLLESLAFVSASNSNKLDNEFLVSRGLRVTKPNLMRSSFEENSQMKNININIKYNSELKEYNFTNKNENYSNWERLYPMNIPNNKEKNEILQDYLKHKDEEKIDLYLEKTDSEKLKELSNIFENLIKVSIDDTIDFINFIIYSPENTALRTFEKEGQIQPLGINGEGLLKLLKVVNDYEDKSYINTIIESLQLFDWFEDIKIPDSLSSGEDKIIIKDKYLYQEIDQRSTNEGFLFILFYITLIVAKETPKIFAIDNIDASLNPKLCTKLMTIITKLAHKYDKQIFLTTHNPAVLDGMDLNDEEQKLFVVSRNKSGHTRMKNITVDNKPKSSNNEPLKLSEAFLRGYLGGLPKGF